MKTQQISPEQWLEEAGVQYLASITAQEPQFLVEIELSDDELSEIFRRLARARPTKWSTAQLTCLALAAVHSAARADQGEDSFRQVFYQRLGREFDHGEWETHYGPKAVGFLKQRLSVELLSSGPYRYVGSIYRHAGIPAPARGRFAALLATLLKDGAAFNRGRYDEVVEKCSSSVLRRFLESSAGYELSQATARFVVRLERGLVSRQELISFPRYRRSLYEAVLRELTPAQRDGDKISTAFFPPILALDPDAGRLVLKFDPKGVAANAYRRASGGIVYYASEPVTDSVRPEFAVRPETEAIPVTPWWVPSRGPGALFRGTDGGIVDTSREVPAGSYYLVTATPECVPADTILEYGAYLEQGSHSDGPYYSILRVDLPPGFAIPELSIQVRGAARPPGIEFLDLDGGRRSLLGRHVFIDRLPSIAVSNWSSDCADRYWIWIDDGSGERRLQVSSGEINAYASCPSQGRIWIEAKYSGAGASRQQELQFAVIPREISIRTVERTYAADQSGQLQTNLPDGWQFEPLGNIIAAGSGKWEIPPSIRVVDGNLTYKSLRISISLIVPRVGLWFRAPHEGSTIWREEMSPSLPIVVDGLRGGRCRIMLRNGTDPILPICDLGALPDSGSRKITLAHFKDALAICGVVSGQFVLSVDHEDVLTDRFFASAVGIETSLPLVALDSPIFGLPSIGEDLRQARLVFDGADPGPLFHVELDVPDSLRSFLCGLACLAAELDDTQLSSEQNLYRRFAPSYVARVLEWIDLSRDSLRSLGNERQVISTFPASDVEMIRVSRWRNSINDLLRQVILNLDLEAIVGRWNQAVREPDCERDSELVARAQGRQLTEAARKYSSSFTVQGKSRNDALTFTIIDLQSIVCAVECDPIVKLLASAMLQLAFFRSDCFEDAAQVTIANGAASCARLISLMDALAARCQGGPTMQVHVGGIGFFEVSGKEEDRKLELELSEHTTVRGDQIPTRQSLKRLEQV